MMKEINFGLQGYRLLQAPNMTLVQMMSYIIQPPSGPVVVIDGGNTGDADYLRDEIMKRGGEVEAWIITHCHDDHYAALIEIMNNPGGVKINRIYYNFPPQEWINQTEPVYKVQTGKIFDLLHTYTDICTVVCEGDVIEPAGLKIEFLHDPARFATYRPVDKQRLCGKRYVSCVSHCLSERKDGVVFRGSWSLCRRHVGRTIREKAEKRYRSNGPSRPKRCQ